MNKKTFEKIKCPVLLCYWYKNEKVQDDQASVKAMLEMYDALGTPDSLKNKQAFPDADNHAIDCYFISPTYKAVAQRTELFLDQVVLK